VPRWRFLCQTMEIRGHRVKKHTKSDEENERHLFPICKGGRKLRHLKSGLRTELKLGRGADGSATTLGRPGRMLSPGIGGSVEKKKKKEEGL